MKGDGQLSSYDTPLIIQARPSRLLLLILILSHLMTAVLIVSFVNIHIGFQLVILGMIILSFMYYYRLHISRGLNKSVVRMKQSQHSGWSIMTNDDEDLSVKVQGASYSSPWMVILNVSHEVKGSYTMIVPFDSVSESLHRQLRVRLKIMSG